VDTNETYNEEHYSEYADLNRWVFNWDLNVVIVSDCRMCGGREFQSLGAVQLKARAPMVTRRGVGTVSRPAEEERREREGVYS